MAKISMIAMRTFVSLLALGPTTAASIAFAGPSSPGSDEGGSVQPLTLTLPQVVRFMYQISKFKPNSKIAVHALSSLGYNSDEASQIMTATQDIVGQTGSIKAFAAVANGTAVRRDNLDPQEVSLLRSVVARAYVRLHHGWDGYTWEGGVPMIFPKP